MEKPSAKRLAAPRISRALVESFGADHAGHDRKGGHRAVDAAIDPVAQIAGLRARP